MLKSYIQFNYNFQRLFGNSSCEAMTNKSQYHVAFLMKDGNNPTGIFQLKVLGTFLTFLFKEAIQENRVSPEECNQESPKSHQKDSKKWRLCNWEGI